MPKKALKRDNRYQRDKKRKLCKRRAAIEPIIGHLKSDFRLSRNLFKGQIGDEINVLMAACAWNLRKWMVAVAIFLFWKKSGLIVSSRPLKIISKQTPLYPQPKSIKLLFCPACAWNLRKWMVAVAIFLFWKKRRLIFCKIPEVFFVVRQKSNLFSKNND
jgi:hypothetical protein